MSDPAPPSTLGEVLPDEIERALSDIAFIGSECFDATMNGTGKALLAAYGRLRTLLLSAQLKLGSPLPVAVVSRGDKKRRQTGIVRFVDALEDACRSGTYEEIRAARAALISEITPR
jgi:hypothetical protein